MTRPSLELAASMVVKEQYHVWPDSTVVSCMLTFSNGHTEVGNSRPYIAGDYSVEQGSERARANALAAAMPGLIFYCRAMEHMESAIAREIHDAAKQALSTAVETLAVVAQKADTSQCVESPNDMAKAHAKAPELIHDLHVSLSFQRLLARLNIYRTADLLALTREGLSSRYQLSDSCIKHICKELEANGLRLAEESVSVTDTPSNPNMARSIAKSRYEDC
ncbi:MULTISPECIES: hypothetical protein [Pseudomonas]|uniref:RNA polymerase alpha subunit C-terminal domain-containing protein n=1 Tax=Pseudomonas lutea TaxID=243924 RepID=A0A9X8MH52_9PSED|nr:MULTISPECIES: hypothetical protein [Pseudomonas]SER37127.1 hypothetical protein SAMN05216409_11882 [Pseudomonas lutea]